MINTQKQRWRTTSKHAEIRQSCFVNTDLKKGVEAPQKGRWFYKLLFS